MLFIARATKGKNSFKIGKSLNQDLTIILIRLNFIELLFIVFLNITITSKDFELFFIILFNINTSVELKSSLTIDFIFSLLFFLVFDFVSFVYHFSAHKIPVLWSLHRIHHTATSLNLFTSKRLHILEDLLYFVFKSTFLSILYIIFILLGYNVSHILLFGIIPFFFGFLRDLPGKTAQNSFSAKF